MADDAPTHPPSHWLRWLELRAAGEFVGAIATWPLLRLAKHGDRHTVLVLPGLMAGDAHSTRARRVYEWASGQAAARHAGPPSRDVLPALVPCTSVYSRSDGVVAWRASLQPEGPLAEDVEVIGSHVGLGVHAPVLYVIADRLAQPEGRWKCFQPPWALRALYPQPHRVARRGRVHIDSARP